MTRSSAFCFCSLMAALLVASASAAEREPLKIIHSVQPAYPLRLQVQGIKSGDTQLLLYIDERGKLQDHLVVGYSRKEFADAAVAAVKRWQFEPMRVGGVAVPTTQEVHFSFEVEGLLVVIQTAHEHVQQQIERMAPDLYRYRSYTLRDLDRLPEPRTVVAPSYPQQLADQGVTGRVSVEFYIDEEGHVRMPAILQSEHEELSASAILAVRRWTFEPPVRHGQPVLVRAVQDFNFAPRK